MNADEQDVADRLARRAWPARPIRPEISVSFEYFPAATQVGATGLAACARRLDRLAPEFVSVTFGAGGSTRDRTVDTIAALRASSTTPVAGHLTCVGATKQEVLGVVDRYLDLGVGHIVALRGDAPADGDSGQVTGGFADAAELVAALRRYCGDQITISVAAYPEVHPKASSAHADLDNLRRKLDAGADRALTQFFFDTGAFVHFLERARGAGIGEPIVPGIMPVGDFAKVESFSRRCGTVVPAWMPALFSGLDDDPTIHQMVAATVAAEQCRHLVERGVVDFHFYTMNKPELTEAICRILGLQLRCDAADESVRAS